MINPISTVAHVPQTIERPGAGAAGGFQDALRNAVEAVNSTQKSANASVERFLSGEGEELHQVALEQQKAAVSFDLLLQVRNKVVQAYQEILRMPV